LTQNRPKIGPKRTKIGPKWTKKDLITSKYDSPPVSDSQTSLRNLRSQTITNRRILVSENNPTNGPRATQKGLAAPSFDPISTKRLYDHICRLSPLFTQGRVAAGCIKTDIPHYMAFHSRSVIF